MKTGLKKSQKTTEIYFDEASSWITVSTYNTSLKNRLTAYSEKYPKLCKQIDDTENGGLTFEIMKGRFCFRLTEPYSEKRRAAASEFARKQNNHPVSYTHLAPCDLPYFTKAIPKTAEKMLQRPQKKCCILLP